MARAQLHPWTLLALLPILLWVGSCASSGRDFERTAQALGFERQEVNGLPFRHVLFTPSLPDPKLAADGQRRLHVYLADDGSPWIDSSRVASDPTPRNSVVLELMATDPAPSVLIGRPCYHLAGPPDEACNPLFWTHQRYSETVVESLVVAIEKVLLRRNISEVGLFGYSGGGVLAMLVAERLPQVRTLVTVAANLDTEAWCEHHGYTRLRGSLNPASRPALPSEIRQLHLAGERDRVVPPPLIRLVVSKQPGAEFRSLEAFDHSCCWKGVWPDVLDWVEQAATAKQSHPAW